MNRKKLRKKYRLQEEPCNDCLVTTFCSSCGVCQEARELETRGIYLIVFQRISFIFPWKILAGPQGNIRIGLVRSQPQPAYRK